MKKLTLLKPTVTTCYLNDGKGEKVTYLEILKNFGKEELAHDIEAGAKHLEGLKELLERTEDEVARVVVMRGSNEESLYLAANYLAGICNKQGKKEEEDSTIYAEVERLFQFDDNDFDFEIEEEEDSDIYGDSKWVESPYRLPLIEMSEVLRHSSNNAFAFGFGGECVFVSDESTFGRKPFWMSCHKEPVAIVLRKYNSEHYAESYNVALERFKTNRQVFILVLEQNENTNRMFSLFQDDSSEEDDSEYVNAWDQRILSILLESTADSVKIGCSEEQLVEYYKVLFENQIKEKGYKLASNCSKNEIVDKILALRNQKKAELIENVIKYAIKENRKPKGAALTDKDFEVLKSFRSLSQKKAEGNKKSIDKMENEFIGMKNVKEQVQHIVQTMKYVKYREKNGLGKCNFHNVHLLIGAPGTAKSSIAKLLGCILYEERLLPDNRFICINGADLKGRYVGQTAPRVKKLFEEYDIIMIDEAYSLTAPINGEIDSYSQEALAQLMIELEDHSDDKLVLFAGYGGINVSEKDNKMKQFLDGNPGLKSRINTTIFFDSYQPEEMVQIVHCQAKLQNFTIKKEADRFICDYFASRVQAQDFGNGREARSLVENAIGFAAERVMKLPEKKRTKKALEELTAEDMKKAICRLNEGNSMQRGRERMLCGF